MFKMLKSYIYSDTPFQTKIFYIVTVGAFIACIVGAASALINGLPYTGSLFAAFIIALLMLYVAKTSKAQVGSYLLIILMDCFMFPYCYYTEGGIDGGVSMWYILSFFAVFLLAHGKWFWIMLLLSLLSMAATYTLAYFHPGLVNPLESELTMYMDFMFSILIIGTICGVIVRFQNQVYLEEQKKILKQNEELERLSKTKNSFFANMSHEIRTPINTIIGLNEMILREEISDEVAENAVHIQSASKMLLSLINDILDMSKLESGKMEVVPIQYETGALFSDLVNIIWIRAQEKNLELNLDISPEIPTLLYGDAVRIKQVVMNLLTNAVKYTPKGYITLSAKTEPLEQDSVLLTISVKDSGIGVKKEDMQHLFQSFQRVDEASNAGIEGTGLGLMITQQLVELMGGKIAVDSIYQKGSTFTVQLEQQVLSSVPMRSKTFMTKASIGQRQRHRQLFEAPDARVLVVDDNELNLLVAKKLLRDTNIKVDLAKSGLECLEQTREYYYDVIFMDHMMPEMDGLEVLRRLRKQENGLCQQTPVIALTANASSDADQAYRERGFSGYLSKPVSGTQMETMLLKFLPKDLVEYNVIEGDAETENLIQTVTSAARKKVHITAECVCDVPNAFLDKYGIDIMHYYVYTDKGRFRDMIEMTSDNLLEYLMQTGETRIKTETAPMEEYERFFADALDKGEHIIHFTMTQKLTSAFTMASASAQSFDNVTVVDSEHLSSGMGLLVLHAADLAEKGYSAEEIMAQLDELKSNMHTSFVVPSVKALYENGKISQNIYRFCNLMNIHPVLKMKKGLLTLGGIHVGDMGRAYIEYIRSTLKDMKYIDNRIVFITYSGCSARQLKSFREAVEKYGNFERIIMQKASATISGNCGLGTMGLSFIWKE